MGKKSKLFLLLTGLLILSLGLTGCFNDKEVEEEPDQEVDLEEDEEVDDSEDTSLEEERLDLTKLPEFKLKDIDGKEVSSDIFNEYKLTVVPIWQSTCGPCIEELDALNTIYEKYKDQGVNVLGIALDDVEIMGDGGVKNVVETLDLNYINVIADEDYMMELINYVQGTPTAFIIGEDREILIGPRVGSNGKDQDIEDFTNIIEDIIAR